MRTRDSLLVLAVAVVAGVGAFMVNFQGTPALAQGAGASGDIIALPFQISQGQEDLVLIDTSRRIMAVYEISTRNKPVIELKGARDFSFDLKVPTLSTEPPPRDVEREVEKLNKNKPE